MTERLDGVIVATALPYAEDPSAPAGLRPDLDKFAEHCRWVVENGCRGVGPNGSLGEYSSLTDAERREVAQTAIAAVKGRGIAVIGVHGVGAHQARHWAELAAEDGADGVLCLPPTMYRANRGEVVHHFREVAKAGLPIMVYNNPIAYGVDVTIPMFEELAKDDLVVAMKESTDDIRRITDVFNAFGDRFDVFTGVDNLAFESLVMGAHGWVAGLVVAFPKETVAIYKLVLAGRLDEARAIYRWFRPLLDLDVSTFLVQNIKLAEVYAMGSNDRVRGPRLPLTGETRIKVAAVIEKALASRPELPKL